jgi:hypothetical protein
LQKTSVILICALSFGAVGVSKASPPDSPDIVYVDGQPCNSACQSYMAWSRQLIPTPGQRQRMSPTTAAGDEKSPNAAGRRATRIREAESNQAANDRTAKQAGPTSDVAVDGKLSAAASNRVRTAIAAAGAGEVQLADSRGKAVDRVISGEVPAAVLTLVSPEAAEMFPKIAGFRILRIRFPLVRTRQTNRDEHLRQVVSEIAAPKAWCGDASFRAFAKTAPRQRQDNAKTTATQPADFDRHGRLSRLKQPNPFSIIESGDGGGNEQHDPP